MVVKPSTPECANIEHNKVAYPLTLVGVFSLDGILLKANQAALDVTGLRPEEAIGKSFDRIEPLSHKPEVTEQMRDMLQRAARGDSVSAALEIRVPAGGITVVDCMCSPLRDAQGQISQLVCIGVEIARDAEAQIAVRLNRELRMLSTCTQVLMRAREEHELLQSICNIIVSVGQYGFAWVGFADNDFAPSLRPGGWSDIDPDYLKGLTMSWAASEHGSGPIGTARRKRAIQVCHNLEKDVMFAPWTAEAQRLGYKSSVILPLLLAGDELGFLTIYADRLHAFGKPEIALLSELANDLSYGIRALRAQVEHRAAQARIAHLTRITRMQSAINTAVLRIPERDALLREACRLAAELGGYDRATALLVDSDTGYARPQFWAGTGEEFPEPEKLHIGDASEPDTSLVGRALRTGEIVVCTDLTQAQPPVALRERLIGLGYKTVIALPLIVDGHRLGCLRLASRTLDLVSDEELLLLREMGASLSFGLRSQEQADVALFLTFYDPLTGLAKRALFCQRLERFLSEHPRPGGNPAIAAFDIHLLSSINDTYGRHFGDLLIQEVAERLKRHSGGDEHIGYLGGGTFVLMEPELSNCEESITARLANTVFDESFSIERHTIRVTCRLGVARYPVDGVDSDTLVQKAEAALTHAKETGEQYVHYALSLHSEIAERLALEHKLRGALAGQQFELHYQPLLSLATGRIESVEALLRWNDPERGLVGPGEFLRVLEASGLIIPVGSWVLRQAVRDCWIWSEVGLGPVRVAVNVSALQIQRRAFVPEVLELLDTVLGNAPGYGLDLEITETALLQDLQGVSRKLEQLRAAGIRIALDDFGTGYSCLGLLSSLPVDLLKIDRSFVSGLPRDRAARTLVSSIINLASAFGLLSVAEGVETAAQIEMLRAMKCNQSQGYFYSVALPAAQIERQLAAGCPRRDGPNQPGV